MWLFGKGKSPKAQAPLRPAQCTHPVSHQVTLHEDPSAPTHVTGVKCSQCGERVRSAA